MSVMGDVSPIIRQFQQLGFNARQEQNDIVIEIPPLMIQQEILNRFEPSLRRIARVEATGSIKVRVNISQLLNLIGLGGRL
ncbi:MAG: hypothetical protein DRP11_03450 [Candidatus Aenigmatarchaeota archaeon]|nr:MAG: hypothetical protein DRP11_03450 [Candidatus Aenigmarchaeota archaeon]